MSAYVPNHQHDIFVSYAHVDDLPLPGYEEGWVTTLIAGLKIHLSQKLGRSDFFSLWKDEQLLPNKPFTPEIMTALKNSATLIIILSPGYMASNWCQREMQTYWQEIANRNNSDSSIFVVERDKLEFEEKPKVLEELPGYVFWVQEREGRAPKILGEPKAMPGDQYYDKLGDLAYDLAKELKQLKANAEKKTVSNMSSKGPPDLYQDERPAVFLAEVTDDMDTQRDQVSRYLDQAGFRVFPSGTTNYPAYLGGSAGLSDAIENDLKKCRLFIQLLSGLQGKISPGKASFPVLQYQAAMSLNVPVMQWHAPDLLNTGTILSEELRALLEGDKVLVVGLEEFKQECVKQLQAQLQPPKPLGNLNMIYLNTSIEDKNLGEEISKELKELNIACSLPAFSTDPKVNDEDHKFSLIDCDGLIFIYGPASYSWARSQIRMSMRTLALRDKPLKALAVYDGPPESKPDLGLEIPGMITLNCRKGLHQEGLRLFLDALGKN